MVDVAKNAIPGQTRPVLLADGTEVSERAMKELTTVLRSLADRSRLRILLMLARDGEMHVSAISDELDQSQPAVSHHLNQLKKAGLIDFRRDGKFNYYRLDPEGLAPLAQALNTSNQGDPRLVLGGLEVVIRRA